MTIIIIFITVVVSILCFYTNGLLARLALVPYLINRRKQWYRIITHGFVHADYTHLLVNMLVLWSFGTAVENMFKILEHSGTTFSGSLTFLLLYFGGMVVASMYDVIKRKNDINFLSVGASGAVSAVIFSSIFFGPMEMVYFFGIIPIPGIVFGVLYLLYERYLAKKQNDNVNHYAHIFGAVYGFIFPLLLDPFLIKQFFAGF